MTTRTALDDVSGIALGILLTVFGLLGLCLLQAPELFPAAWRSSTRLTLHPSALGTIERRAGAVRLRPASSPFWHDLDFTVSVSSGDRVFTGPTGRAALLLPNGQEAEILPDSLIALEPGATGFFDFDFRPVLRLQKGLLRLRLPTGTATRLRIGEQDREIALKPLEGAEKPEKRWIEIATVPEDASGRNFTLQSENPVEISPAEGAPASSTLVKPEPVRILAPQEGTLLFTAGQPTELHWEMPQSHATEIDISGPEGELRLASRPEERTRSARLRPGAYRWRIRAGDYASPWTAFQLQALEPPRLLAPSSGTSLPDRSALQEELFLWERLPMQLTPELEILNEANAPQALVRPATPEGAVAKLGPGRYRWRARVSAASESSAWTPWNTLEIGRPAGAPAPLTPVGDPEFTARFEPVAVEELAKPPAFRLSWSSVKGSTGYAVRLLSKSGRVVQQRRTRATTETFAVASAEHLELAAEIRAEGPQPRDAKLAIRLPLPAPRLIRPNSGQDAAGFEGIPLVWTRTALARDFELQLSRSPDFSPLLRANRLSRNWSYFRPSASEPSGTVYWRVRAVASGHRSAWSETRTLLLH
ncbi:MAG: FecR family protein [Oligoflexia bacterium]|nr:FecR family protein [Oligoflexia bacterium]